jgi:hypothetical protein
MSDARDPMHLRFHTRLRTFVEMKDEEKGVQERNEVDRITKAPRIPPGVKRQPGRPGNLEFLSGPLSATDSDKSSEHAKSRPPKGSGT